MKTVFLIALFSLMWARASPIQARALPLAQKHLWLARNGKTLFNIVLPENANKSQQFAGSELASYLERISTAVFSVGKMRKASGSILLQVQHGDPADGYDILLSGKDIILQGHSDRALLYAVYDFLGRLGCRWLAPGFDFNSDADEYVPRKPALSLVMDSVVHEKPVFTLRKIDIEEGRTHNTQNLKKIIAWMPKLRYNILMAPLDYRNYGRVRWDNWRKELIPELEKRDLLVEVGGHGYQNFLNPRANDSILFRQHPEWFGRDSSCLPNASKSLVFNTANPAAVQHFMSNIIQYIREHPEIDIFDFWPPDVARWADCPDLAKLGTAEDRQAMLANQVDSALREIRPDLKLEIIAYARALYPPQTIDLRPDILVDFCPINQSFEVQIYDSGSAKNRDYVNALGEWRRRFPGDIGLYSYYRKYGWRSLPNIIPHYIQKDLQWYAQLPLQGISTYAEPGDWGTYELNHYTLGALAWNPDLDLDSLIRIFCEARYGASASLALGVYALLERLAPVYSSIPNTSLKTASDILQAQSLLENQITILNKLSQNLERPFEKSAIIRLSYVMSYLRMDLGLQGIRAGGPGKASALLKELEAFLRKNRDQGLFILPSGDVAASLRQHYGVPEQNF